MDKRVSVIVLCIDYRFWPEVIENFKREYEKFDLIALAGGARNLSSPSNNHQFEVLIDNIATSVKLHHANHLVLTNHVDCGAYGGSGKFQDCEREFGFHSEELKKAKQIAQDNFPALNIETVLITRQDGRIGYERVL